MNLKSVSRRNKAHMIDYVTFKEMAAICGNNRAYEALLIIERAARLQKNNIISLDCEKRMRKALEAMRDAQLAAEA